MTYRSLTCFVVVPFLAVSALVACSDDPDAPYSGASAEQGEEDSPSNADGPLIAGYDFIYDENGNATAVAIPGSGAAATGVMGPASGSMALPSGTMAPPSGSMALPSGTMAPPSGSMALPSGTMAPPSGSMAGGISCDIYEDVLQPACAGGGCHDSVAFGAFATSEEVALGFIGTPTRAVGCGDFIDTENPLESAMWEKTLAQPCGGLVMPAGGRAFSQSQRDCLQEWLESL